MTSVCMILNERSNVKLKMTNKKKSEMNSLHAVSTSKNNNTQYTAQSLGITHDLHMDSRALDTYWLCACCYFWMHSLRADCSSNYFFTI